MDKHTVIIAGAGPGGLAAALTLHQRGIPVRMFESVPLIRPLGVGINVLPHSVAILHQLGLQAELEQVAVLTSELRYTNKWGQLIWCEPRGLAAGYAYPQYSIHRGELQMILLRAVQTRLGHDAVHTGFALVDWQDHADHITVQFRTPDGSVINTTGACLIAADGIRSTARRRLVPEEGEPLYGGRVLWRAVSDFPPYLDGRTMIMAGYPEQKFVCYPISPTPSPQGTLRTNWIAELSVPEDETAKQDWNRIVGRDRFATAFSAWRFDWLDVPSLIERADTIYEYPLFDRNPLARWTYGRMTLLGDAAHPMYPIGSNGASQAILDAVTLANEMATQPDITTALEAYEAQRRPPTTKIVLANRQHGPEQVMQLAEQRAPNGFNNIHDVISPQELEDISTRYKQTAGFAVSQVNKGKMGD